jgi:hypothetical protein
MDQRLGLPKCRPTPLAVVAYLPAAALGGQAPGIGMARSPVMSSLAAGDGSTGGRGQELRAN